MKKNTTVNNTLVKCDVCDSEITNLLDKKAAWYFHGGVNGVVEKTNIEYKIQTQRGIIDAEKIHKAGYSAFPQMDICSVACFKKAIEEWIKTVEGLLEEPAKLTQKLAETIVNEIEKPEKETDS